MKLITLFNIGVEFVKVVSDAVYVPADEKKATHRLVCTDWNSDKKLSTNARKRIRELKTRPRGLALAVCAVPLKRKARPTGTHRLRYRIPPDLWPTYLRKGSLASKRKTLLEFVPAHRSGKKFRKQVLAADSARCDSIYLCLIAANRIAKRRRVKHA